MSTIEKHKLSSKDRKRVKCFRCGAPAVVVHWLHWEVGNRKGTSFFPHCKPCDQAHDKQEAERAAEHERNRLANLALRRAKLESELDAIKRAQKGENDGTCEDGD